MTLDRSSLGSVAGSHPLLVASLLALVLVGAMLVLTVLFGVQGPGPSFEIVPDPAGAALPF